MKFKYKVIFAYCYGKKDTLNKRATFLAQSMGIHAAFIGVLIFYSIQRVQLYGKI